MAHPDVLEIDIKRDLYRLARLGANITDAHSCFIFVPPYVLNTSGNTPEEMEYLDLGGYHSLSQEVLEPCRLLRGTGIVGWVAKHRQPIHVSPFEHDSRTLGMYKSDQQLKSFIGIPIFLQLSGHSVESAGVLGCDSKKSYAFSKLQGKLLQDLAFEIAHTIKLSRLHLDRHHPESSWTEFLERGEAVAAALGSGEAEVLRAALVNFGALEAGIGTGACIDLIEQVYRLIQQALPPHFPVFHLPNGDVVMVVDKMMSSYYENKITGIANRIASKNERLRFKFYRSSRRGKQGRFDLEKLVSETSSGSPAFNLTKPISLELNYEYRRA